MENATKLLKLQLAIFKPFVNGCSIAVARKGQSGIGALMLRSEKKSVLMKTVNLGDFNAKWLSPKNREGDSVVLYLHGGGYTCGDMEYASGFGSVLAVMLKLRVFCVDYRLAPEAPFPAAVDDAYTAYRHLLHRGIPPEKILLAGESAGGGLIFALALKLRSLGEPLPAGFLALSPWTDLSQTNASYEFNGEKDPTLTKERLDYYASLYCSDPSDPLASPLHGDLCEMPPSLIIVGGDEILLDDSVLMAKKLREGGSECELVVVPEMWHVFPLYGVKEAEKSIEKIVEFAKAIMQPQ